ncbi:MAG: transposase [Bacteroidales bacterium]|nr:transposase [Bacteroidales bacterium]
MATSPVTCRTLEQYYHVNANTLEKQYKDVLSGFREWSEAEHAIDWLVYPENIGPNLAIDETSLSRGNLYTIVTNRDRHGGERCLVAIVRGVRSEDVINVLEHIPEEARNAVEEVTLDLSDSMRKIVRTSFPNAQRVIDRFHIQKLACEAVQDIRITHRWAALQQANEEMRDAKLGGEEYVPLRFENGDTRKELLARSRYLLYKSGDKWTDSQKARAEILFREYPDIKEAYGLSHSLRMIFSKKTFKAAARLHMAKWYDKVDKAGFESFNIIAATFYEHYDDILNFYNNRSSNASAESFNSKIKSFRAMLRGIVDEKFFLFRLATIYAHPH